VALSQSIEKLQHFVIGFDEKNQRNIVTFVNFEMTGNLRWSMLLGLSIFVTRLNSIESFFHSFIAI
jgi:hypothetical protein